MSGHSGRCFRARRPDIIVIDDPYAHATVDVLDAALEKWRTALLDRLNDPSIKPVIIMAKLHDDDHA